MSGGRYWSCYFVVVIDVSKSWEMYCSAGRTGEFAQLVVGLEWTMVRNLSWKMKGAVAHASISNFTGRGVGE